MSVYRLERGERILILCAGLGMLAVGVWLGGDVKVLGGVALAVAVPFILRGTVLRPKPPQ